MAEINKVTFGKRNRQMPTILVPSKRRVNYLHVSIFFAVSIVGIALVFFGLWDRVSTASKTESNIIENVGVEFIGIWATGGQSCDAAVQKVIMDGNFMSSISRLGILPIGKYLITGNNPIQFKFVDSDQSVVWDVVEKDRVRNSRSGVNGSEMENMLDLTRC